MGFLQTIRRTAVLLLTYAMLAGTSMTGFALTFSGGFTETQADGDFATWVEAGAYKDLDEARHSLRADSISNTVTALKRIPADGISMLILDAKQFGVVAEPTDQKEITVDLVGVKYPGNILVTTSTADGALAVKVEPKNASSLFMSTVKGDLVNVVRVGIPAGSVKSIVLEDRNGSCILVNNLDLPVTGTIASGVARIQSDALTSAVNMETASGKILVRAKTVTGSVTMWAVNGTTSVEADTVTGKTILRSINGAASLTAGSVREATLGAVNGAVNLAVGTITEKVSAGVENGTLQCTLTKKPQNLKFLLNSTGAVNDNIDLPEGWKNGYTIGDGKPVLALAIENGVLEFDLAPAL